MVSVIDAQSFKKEPILLYSEKGNIKIEPGTRLNVNGKDGYFDALDKNTMIFRFTLDNVPDSVLLHYSELKKIVIPRIERSANISDTYFSEYVSRGFKLGLQIGAVSSFIAGTFFMKDNDVGTDSEWEISDGESLFVYSIITTPFVCGSVGGLLGLLKRKKVKDSISIKIGDADWKIME